MPQKIVYFLLLASSPEVKNINGEYFIDKKNIVFSLCG